MASEKRHTVHYLFVYLLIGLFALGALMTVLFAAQVYKNIVSAGVSHNNTRLAQGFIVNTVHAQDHHGAVRVENGEEGDRLILRETEEEQDYYTVLYCADGKLRQAYTSDPEKAVRSGMGEPVCDAQHLALALEGSLLTVELTMPDGSVINTAVALKTE